jgi:signal transduction histidine kinase
MIYSLYLSSLVISTILLSALAFIFWRRRSMRGATHAAWLMLSAAIYAFGTVLQLVNTNFNGQVVAEGIQYLGIVFIPVVWFTFSISYTGRDSWFSKKILLFLLIIPFTTIILAWTNGHHELIWYNRHLETSGPFVIIAKGYGPWFWVHTSSSYLLILAGMLTIIRRLFRRPRLYRQQGIALVISVLVPVIWNVFYVFNLVPIYRIDLTPSAFTISGLAMIWGLFRSRLLDIVPIAYENIIEVLNQGIFILDTQNRIIDMNTTAEKILSCPISRAIGQTTDTFLLNHPDLNSILSDEPTSVPSEILIRKGEKENYYLVHIALLNDWRGNPIGRMVSLIDNTEFRQVQARRRELEARNQLMSRLSTVGEMAAGIAHEVSNPLATVLGYSELLLKRDVPKDMRKDLEVIGKGAERAAAILERLLTFTGQQDGIFESVQVNSVIESAIDFRKHSLAVNNIDIIRQFDEKLPITTANGSQLQEVFLNLLMNAESAIAEAGKEGRITISTEKNEDNIHVFFEDNGAGISPGNLDKIFNPFFTTKKVGKGTGLGLSICHGIITGHNGEITVKSEPGNGSTFTITLPIARSSRSTNNNDREK